MQSKIIYLDNSPSDYIIYSNGQIYSNKTNKYLKPLYINDDYPHVILYHNNKKYIRYIHILVASYFIPNDMNKPEVNHIDGNKLNFDVTNLEWVTKSENIIHAFKTGLHKPKIGSDSHLAKYDDNTINNVCQLLEEGVMTLSDISKVTGVSFSMIYLIVKHKSWVNISSKYNIDNYYHDRDNYTHDMYEIVFKLLSENRLSLYEISDISGVRYSSINSIKRYVKNPVYNDLYKIYDISKYTGGYIKYKEITEDCINEIHRLYSKGIPNKYIKRIISKEFNINEEKIRVYMRTNMM